MTIRQNFVALLLVVLGGANSLAASEFPPEEVWKALVVSAPRPDYPLEARRFKITGSGVCMITIDTASGAATRAEMVQSTGSRILDNAAVGAFRRWRFKPGTVSKVRLPVTFTLTGAASFDPNRAYPFSGTVRAVNERAHYITVHRRSANDVVLVSTATKLTKNSVPIDLREVAVGDEVNGFAKITPERVAVITTARFKSRPKR